MSTLAKDSSAFEAHQRRMLLEILITVRDGFVEAGVKKEKRLRELTENLAFHLACIVDGSRVMNTGAEYVHPVLAFTKGIGKKPDYAELIYSGGGSWMHEILDEELTNEVFEKDDS
ncbi:hypothetical protein [Polaromonas aquatica]|uniref:hypothetical protein n=1 Tax=Polaromonas aquatica TaxID=332657 RepID=UPI003D654223